MSQETLEKLTTALDDAHVARARLGDVGESDVIGPDDIDKLREPAKRLAAWRRLITDTDELYDPLAQTRGGYGRLQDFGVRFGYERVVIHLEPAVEPHRLQANTARTMLLLDHESLPWTRWGDEFAAAMPGEIRRLQEHAASTDGTPRQEAIRSRVASIIPLYRLSPYRPAQLPRRPSLQREAGPAEDAPAHASSRNDRPADEPRDRPSTSAAPQSAAHDVACDLLSGTPPGEGPDEEARGEASVSLPDVGWISARDGSRAEGDLEDQAARYHPARHELTINADFRAITDMIGYWRRRYEGVPGARAVIEAQVCEWCEQVLVEVVLAARHSKWDEDQLAGLLSPTSLSAALLPRHLLHSMLQKRLGQKLGAPHARQTRADPSGRHIDVARSRRSAAKGSRP